MDKIYHPVSGEEGYFIDEQEKAFFSALVSDFNAQNIIQRTSHNVRGGADE